MNQNSFKNLKFHFIGIGGIGMSALARYLHSLGGSISGSDKENSILIDDLKSEGIKKIWTPHSKGKIQEIHPDFVVFSTAISDENEELLYSKEKNIPLLHRSELLEKIANDKKTIAISGTHGKTTTSSMVYEMLASNNISPSAILGGLLSSKNTNVITGSGEYLVIEADESDKSFLRGNPEIAIITNIEADHLENYPGGMDEIKKSFLEFAMKAKSGLVCCFQDAITKELITSNFDLKNKNIISYGISPYVDINEVKLFSKFNHEKKNWDVYFNQKYISSFKLQKPGEHNVLNALAAFSVGILLKLEYSSISSGLEKYEGVKRRFEIIGNKNNVTYVDDYAHHPTEILETIKAAKELNPKRLLIVFQPHQAYRLHYLWDDFINVFQKQNDEIFITDLYIARGKEIDGVNSKNLVKEINKPNISYLSGDLDKISTFLKGKVKAEDLVLIMGAGSITNLPRQMLL